MEDGSVIITAEMVGKYHELSLQVKRIEGELDELKKVFHQFFDMQLGEEEKGEYEIGEFKLQRQIRESEGYHEINTVKVLEELNLTDCIQIVKKPDKEKIDAAITLGLLSSKDLAECIHRKVTKAIVVKKV